MQEFATQRATFRPSRRGALIATLAVLVIVSVGFAAAGGLEMIKGWLMTVTVQVDGETFAVENVTTDEEGRATFALSAGTLEGGKEISLTIAGEGAPGESGGAKTVTVELSPDQTVTVEISAEDETAEIRIENENEAQDAEQTQTP